MLLAPAIHDPEPGEDPVNSGPGDRGEPHDDPEEQSQGPPGAGDPAVPGGPAEDLKEFGPCPSRGPPGGGKMRASARVRVGSAGSGAHLVRTG